MSETESDKDVSKTMPASVTQSGRGSSDTLKSNESNSKLKKRDKKVKSNSKLKKEPEKELKKMATASVATGNDLDGVGQNEENKKEEVKVGFNLEI